MVKDLGVINDGLMSCSLASLLHDGRAVVGVAMLQQGVGLVDHQKSGVTVTDDDGCPVQLEG